MARSESLLCGLLVALAGCSLVLDAEDHRSGSMADSGAPDGGSGDGGASDSGAEDGGAPDDAALDGAAPDAAPSDMGGCGEGVLRLAGGTATAGPGEGIDPVGSFTLEAWFRPGPEALSGSRNVAGHWGELGISGSYALYLTGGRPAFIVSCDGVATDIITSSGTPALVAEEWVHLAAVFDSSARQGRLYVDGVEQARRGVDCAEPNGLTGVPFQIAYDDPEGGAPAQGFIDEVRLSHVARYDGNFTPEEGFTADPDTALLFPMLPVAPTREATGSGLDLVLQPNVSATSLCRP